MSADDKFDLYSCRKLAGEFLFSNTMSIHDAAFDFLRYKNIDQMPWLFRPYAHSKNFMFDKVSNVTRPAISYAAQAFGDVLDTVAEQTWNSVSPANIRAIIQHPDRAKTYVRQKSQWIPLYWQAIDTNSVMGTTFNFKDIWVGKVVNIYTAQKYIWNHELTSEHSFLSPHKRVMDKSRQLALGYGDVLKDRVAEFVGWAVIGFMAFNIHSSVRMRTQAATDLWARRTGVNRLPIMPRAPLRFFAIKPLVRVAYNPWVLVGLLSFKCLMSMGQSITASIELERRSPGLAGILREQNRDISNASFYNDLRQKLKLRGGVSN